MPHRKAESKLFGRQSATLPSDTGPRLNSAAKPHSPLLCWLPYFARLSPKGGTVWQLRFPAAVGFACFWFSRFAPSLRPPSPSPSSSRTPAQAPSRSTASGSSISETISPGPIPLSMTPAGSRSARTSPGARRPIPPTRDSPGTAATSPSKTPAQPRPKISPSSFRPSMTSTTFIGTARKSAATEPCRPMPTGGWPATTPSITLPLLPERACSPCASGKPRSRPSIPQRSAVSNQLRCSAMLYSQCPGQTARITEETNTGLPDLLISAVVLVAGLLSFLLYFRDRKQGLYLWLGLYLLAGGLLGDTGTFRSSTPL